VARAARNRGVLAPTLALPLILTALSIGVLEVTTQHLSDLDHLLKGQDVRALIIQIGRQMVTLFLLMPCVLPSTSAAHSIVGEKHARSLEPVLATPVRTWELLGGKMLLCVLLGLIPSWFSYAAFLSILHARLPADIFAYLVMTPQWVLVVFIGPLLALLSVSATTLISSRFSDVQAAQSVSVLVALPILGVATSQTIGLLSLTLSAILAAGLLLMLLDLGAVWLCVSLFERETILTRWK
jgi:ABC-2 type transport system permease protein